MRYHPYRGERFYTERQDGYCHGYRDGVKAALSACQKMEALGHRSTAWIRTEYMNAFYLEVLEEWHSLIYYGESGPPPKFPAWPHYPVPAALRRKVFDFYQGSCGICGFAVDPDDYEFDHIVPKSKGGLTEFDNIQPVHSKCNRRKGVGNWNQNHWPTDAVIDFNGREPR